MSLDSSIFSTQRCLGSVVSPVLFMKGGRALLLDEDKKTAVVFAKNQAEANYSVLLLTEFIALLTKMKAQGVILDVDCKKSDLELFYSIPQNELMRNSVPDVFSASDDVELHYNSNPHLIDGSITLVGFPIPSQLFTPLREILLTVSFPTPGYKDYLKHGFMPEEAYRAKKALHVSRIAVIVAILIGVLSPFGAVMLGNKWGYTTLETNQFQKIIRVLQSND